MRNKHFAITCITGLGVLIGGCKQSTVVFGSGTTVGVRLGTSAQQTPVLAVGYDQLDAVILPLAADRSNSPVESACATSLTDCKFVATGSALGANLQDAYSVYSAFDGNLTTGNNDKGGSKLSLTGGIGKVFATGVAAQMVAMRQGNRNGGTIPRADRQQQIVATLASYIEQKDQAQASQSFTAAVAAASDEMTKNGVSTDGIANACQDIASCIIYFQGNLPSDQVLLSFGHNFKPYKKPEG